MTWQSPAMKYNCSRPESFCARGLPRSCSTPFHTSLAMTVRVDELCPPSSFPYFLINKDPMCNYFSMTCDLAQSISRDRNNSNYTPSKCDVFHLLSLNPINLPSKQILKTAPAGSKSDCFLCHFIFCRLSKPNFLLSRQYIVFHTMTALRHVSLYPHFSPLNRDRVSLYFSAKFKPLRCFRRPRLKLRRPRQAA